MNVRASEDELDKRAGQAAGELATELLVRRDRGYELLIELLKQFAEVCPDCPYSMTVRLAGPRKARRVPKKKTRKSPRTKSEKKET